MRVGEFWRPLTNAAVEGLVDLLFPPHCLLCHTPLDVTLQRPLYCGDCQHKIMPDLDGCCFRCGIKLPYRIDGQEHEPLVKRHQTLRGCPDCRRRKWSFDRAVAVGSYEGSWRDHVYQLKRPYHSADAFQAGKLLGERLLQTEWWSDCQLLVPLPIHWRRRYMRGFNQAERIAAGIATVLPLPVVARALQAQRYTRKQGTLAATARQANVQQALQRGPAAAQLQGQNVIVVDDVLTTGSTANVAAKLCRQAGARRVAVAVVARAGRF